jgi:hypothetical protein
MPPPRYGLRSLLVSLAIVAVPAAFVGHRYRAARREAPVVAAVREAGGTIVVEQGPLGFFPRAVLVDLGAGSGHHVVRNGLYDRLPELGRLASLSLAHRDLPDDKLKFLERCLALETLDLTGNRVGDAGITRLAALPRLRELDLTQTDVSDAGIAALQESRPRLLIVDD